VVKQGAFERIADQDKSFLYSRQLTLRSFTQKRDLAATLPIAPVCHRSQESEEKFCAESLRNINLPVGMAPIVKPMMRCTGVRVFLAKEIIMKALSAVRRFIRDERGVTAIEYGLIASLIALAVATSMGSVSTALQDMFQRVVTALTGP